MLGVLATFAAIVVGIGVALAQPVPPEPEPAEPAVPEPAPVPAPPPEPQPPPPPPPPPQPLPPPTTTIETGYPRALAARPLTMPNGGVEGSIVFGYESLTLLYFGQDALVVRPRVRYGIGMAEVEVNAAIVAYQEDPDPMSPFPFEREELAAIGGAGRFVVLPDTAAGLEMTIQSPAADTTTYQPRAVIAHKARMTGRSAAEMQLGIGVDHTSFGDMSIQTGIAEAQLRVQAQIAPLVAVEGRATLRYLNSFEESDPSIPQLDSYLAQDYGLRVVGSLTPDIDAIAGFDVLYAQDEGGDKVFVLGIVARRVP
jgi:hypothetical protein